MELDLLAKAAALRSVACHRPVMPGVTLSSSSFSSSVKC